MSRYTLLWACSLLLFLSPAAAQTTATGGKGVATAREKKPSSEAGKSVAEEAAQQPLVKGLSLSADLFGLVGGLFGNDFQSMEVAAELNLKNRFLPIVEIGYGTTNTTDDDKHIHYKTSAPYFRAGMNYNFFYKKETQSYVFGGLRLGYSSFSYDVDAPDLHDPVWGGSVPFAYKGVSGSATWAEFVVGLRTPIVKNFHMGWTVRYKKRLSSKETPNSKPWYVPGYGENDSVLFGATYNLIYYLPW